MHVLDLSDSFGSQQFHESQVTGMFMVLGPHLSCELFLCGKGGELSSFGDGMGQRLFAVHMKAPAQCTRGCWSVVMIRGGDHDGVQRGELEELAVVREGFCKGKASSSGSEPIEVNVAECRDVFPAHGIEVCSATSPNADDTHVESVVGTGDLSRPRGDEGRRESESGGCLQKSSAVRTEHREVLS
jgi:hypothetical protein